MPTFHPPHLIRLANESPLPAGLIAIGFANDLPLPSATAPAGADGWALIPYGEWPHEQGLQRFDRAAAEQMVAYFRNGWNTLKRAISGLSIYRGHPDLAAELRPLLDRTTDEHERTALTTRIASLEQQYADHREYGSIADLEVRDTGLALKPVLLPAGVALVNDEGLTKFSPHWLAVPLPPENGRPVFSPVLLRSIGLTDRPNIAGTSLINTQPATTTTTWPTLNTAAALTNTTSSPPPPTSPSLPLSASPLPPVPTTTTPPPPSATPAPHTPSLSPSPSLSLPTLPVDKSLLLALLAALGQTLPADATDEQLNQALAAATPTATALTARLEPAALANEQSARTTAETRATDLAAQLAAAQIALANVQAAQSETLLTAAIATGRITAASRPLWAARLARDFAAESAALANEKPAVKTTPRTAHLAAPSPALTAREQFTALVNDRAAQGEDYQSAWQSVKRSARGSALWDQMHQPA